MLTTPNAGETLYARYYDRVFGYMLCHARSRADAEDITSEVFLKLLSGADGFEPERVGASSYVFRVMQTVLTDHYRRERHLFVPLDEVDEMLGTEPDEQLAALDRALETLPQREQEIVVLHYYYGLSHREIAERMRLSYGNVRQLCHTALGRLRREMAENPVPRA